MLKPFIAFFLLLCLCTAFNANALECVITDENGTYLIPPVEYCTNENRCITYKSKSDANKNVHRCGRCSSVLPNCTECDEKFCNSVFGCYQQNDGDNDYSQVDCEDTNTCFLEKSYGKGFSRGCGGCKEKLDKHYEDVVESLRNRPDRTRPAVDLPKQKRNHSVYYTCLECAGRSLCNGKDMEMNEPFLLELKTCYSGMASQDSPRSAFSQEFCYLHYNDFFCIKEVVGEIVYKRCGTCDEPLLPNPHGKERKCFACSENLCNGAIGRLMMPAMRVVWLLLLGVGVPIVFLLLPVAKPFGGA